MYYLLPPGQARAAAAGISAVFGKSLAFVEGYRSFVLRDDAELKLSVSGGFCTFYARFRQGTTYSETPVRLIYADAELRPVPDLFSFSDGGHPGGADDLPV